MIVSPKADWSNYVGVAEQLHFVELWEKVAVRTNTQLSCTTGYKWPPPPKSVLLGVYPSLASQALLGIAAFVIALYFGGRFGIMPAFAADYFGAKNVGSSYGLKFIPWSITSAFGPLAFAYLRQITGSYGRALYIIAGVMAVSTLLPGFLAPPKSRNHDGIFSDSSV